jgi:hypothetical protein
MIPLFHQPETAEYPVLHARHSVVPPNLLPRVDLNQTSDSHEPQSLFAGQMPAQQEPNAPRHLHPAPPVPSSRQSRVVDFENFVGNI